MEVQEVKRLKELEEENRKLKQMPVCRQASTQNLPWTIKSSKTLWEKVLSPADRKQRMEYFGKLSGECQQGLQDDGPAPVGALLQAGKR